MATEMVKAESWKDEMRITFKYEFGDEQWPMVEQLINGESGWNPYAINKSSGACGLFQSLPCSKVLSVAGNLDNIDGQVRWGVDYIRRVYGTPANAYEKWLSRSPHWY
jgi:hypothetical protein